MAVYSSRVRTVTHYEYSMPSGTNGAEFQKAWDAAMADYEQTNKLPRGDAFSISALKVHARDDEVVISWTQEAAR